MSANINISELDLLALIILLIVSENSSVSSAFLFVSRFLCVVSETSTTSVILCVMLAGAVGVFIVTVWLLAVFLKLLPVQFPPTT